MPKPKAFIWQNLSQPKIASSMRTRRASRLKDITNKVCWVSLCRFPSDNALHNETVGGP